MRCVGFDILIVSTKYLQDSQLLQEIDVQPKLKKIANTIFNKEYNILVITDTEFKEAYNMFKSADKSTQPLKPNIYFGYRTYNSINYPDIWFKGNLLASIIGILFSLIFIIVLIYVSNLKFLYALFGLFLYIPLIIFEYKINKKRLAKK